MNEEINGWMEGWIVLVCLRGVGLREAEPLSDDDVRLSFVAVEQTKPRVTRDGGSIC